LLVGVFVGDSLAHRTVILTTGDGPDEGCDNASETQTFDLHELLGINSKLLKLEKKDWSSQSMQNFALFAIQRVALQRGIAKSYH
jgi:hypothetical protein